MWLFFSCDPGQIRYMFTCGTLTCVLKLQWLIVKTYTPKSNSWLRPWLLRLWLDSDRGWLRSSQVKSSQLIGADVAISILPQLPAVFLYWLKRRRKCLNLGISRGDQQGFRGGHVLRSVLVSLCWLKTSQHWISWIQKHYKVLELKLVSWLGHRRRIYIQGAEELILTVLNGWIQHADKADGEAFSIDNTKSKVQS